MATHGNLELKLREKTLYASTTHDGYNTYEALPRWLEFLDAIRNPTNDQVQAWFRNTSIELFPFNYFEGLIGGISHEVIFDVPRKVILHTAYEDAEALDAAVPGLSTRFKKAGILLVKKHRYQILTYESSMIPAEDRPVSK